MYIYIYIYICIFFGGVNGNIIGAQKSKKGNMYATQQAREKQGARDLGLARYKHQTRWERGLRVILLVIEILHDFLCKSLGILVVQ